MYACDVKLAADFLAGCAGKEIGHLLFATHPHRLLCGGSFSLARRFQGRSSHAIPSPSPSR
jgi:hypothetical protein